jgi:hypothetical protein
LIIGGTPTAGRQVRDRLREIARNSARQRWTDYVPVPESSITCGFDDALSLIVTVPDFAPCDFGEKVTLMEQLPPGSTLAPHVEVTPNARRG